MQITIAGGTLTPTAGLTLSRLGFGAMQLAGPNVFGPPADRSAALAVLRTAVELGVTHIDTADFYGPAVVNELIKEALHPYPPELTVVTKVGARRGPDGSWLPDPGRVALTAAVHQNLRRLGVEALDVVNLRLTSLETTSGDSLAEDFGALADLRAQGLIRHLGLSGVSATQLSEAQAIAPVVTVQNLYNLVQRGDDELVDRCARDNIVFVPFFPLGGFSPLQSQVLVSVAASLAVSPQQVALAWLLQRSPAIALIPGTSSLAHLRDNVSAASLVLPAAAVAELDEVGAAR